MTKNTYPWLPKGQLRPVHPGRVPDDSPLWHVHAGRWSSRDRPKAATGTADRRCLPRGPARQASSVGGIREAARGRPGADECGSVVAEGLDGVRVLAAGQCNPGVVEQDHRPVRGQPVGPGPQSRPRCVCSSRPPASEGSRSRDAWATSRPCSSRARPPWPPPSTTWRSRSGERAPTRLRAAGASPVRLIVAVH